MSRTKVTVHTKIGKKLSYYPSDLGNDGSALDWWTLATSKDQSIRFGRFIIHASNIDFVEIH